MPRRISRDVMKKRISVLEQSTKLADAFLHEIGSIINGEYASERKAHSVVEKWELKCKVCMCLWASSPFYDCNGQPYCEKDFLRLFCSCGGCSKVLEKKQPFVTVSLSVPTNYGTDVKKLLYHVACFKCFKCKMTLPYGSSSGAAKSVFARQGQVFCANCHGGGGTVVVGAGVKT